MTRSKDSIAPLAAGLITAAISAAIYAAPTVYPTGTTIYQPDKTWNGYTVFIALEDIGAVVVDMNGNTVKLWTGYSGGAGGPARLLPGGYVLAGGPNRPGHQESNALIQMDWDGNVVWQFDNTEQIETEDLDNTDPKKTIVVYTTDHIPAKLEGLHLLK